VQHRHSHSVNSDAQLRCAPWGAGFAERCQQGASRDVILDRIQRPCMDRRPSGRSRRLRSGGSGYVDLIKRNSSQALRTLLHLGCGAGGYDGVFKQHFAVTGVDISRGMLDMARLRHQDIEYIEGDMRTVRLGREFDAVAIPDSIDYMGSLPELRMAIETAVTHLKPGGILLVVGKTKEIFRDNNFVYTGEQEDLHVTLLENNYINRYRPHTYEATLVYLIRRRGELTIHTECHMLGLFSQAVWEKVFTEAGLSVQETDLDGTYDKYLLGDGAYSLKIFIGKKC
jgi:SAM-dependent methyltransferase